MKYSIIIPTHNHLKDCLIPCLQSIEKYIINTYDVEIIVIDDNSKDNTYDYLMTLNSSIYRIIKNDIQLGFVKSVNKGINISKGEYIVILNNDVEVLNNTLLSALELPFVLDKSVGITSPILYFSHLFSLNFATFFCVMISRNVINDVGILDENVYLGYGEDLDYCIRALCKGYKIIPCCDIYTDKDGDMAGNFPVTHKGGHTFSNLNHVRIKNKNVLYLASKYEIPINLNINCGEFKLNYCLNINTKNHYDSDFIDITNLCEIKDKTITHICISNSVFDSMSDIEIGSLFYEIKRILYSNGVLYLHTDIVKKKYYKCINDLNLNIELKNDLSSINFLKIYDCSLFFDEYELLNIRLEELYDVVDCFVIVEGDHTFQGKPRDLVFDINTIQEKYRDKIKYYPYYFENVKNKKTWHLENELRNHIQYGLRDCNYHDAILLYDADEITNEKTIKYFINTVHRIFGCSIRNLGMKFCYYYYNTRQKEDWYEPKIGYYKDIKGQNLNLIRRRVTKGGDIENAGWHFSFCGGLTKIKNKIQSYSHSEFNKDEFLSNTHINHCIKAGKDLFNRGDNYNIIIPINELPKYIIKNEDRLKKLGYLKNEKIDRKDNENMTSPKFSIVIPTYINVNDKFRKCYESLLKYTIISNVEIIVIANGCIESDVNYLKSINNTNNTNVYFYDKPLGYTKAINEALVKVKGEYVVLLNDDIEFLNQSGNEWLDRLYKPFETNSKIAITGNHFLTFEELDEKFILFYCCMIPKHVIDEIGLLDENFNPGYGEDIDYSIRCKEAGYNIMCVANMQYDSDNNRYICDYPIYHEAEATVHTALKDEWNDITDRNRKYLVKKYKDIKDKNLSNKELKNSIDKVYEFTIDNSKEPIYTKLEKIKNIETGTYDKVICNNQIEKIQPEHIKDLLLEFRRILKDGALCHIELINVTKYFTEYLSTDDYDSKLKIMNKVLAYGEYQNNNQNKFLFDFVTFKPELFQAGFVNINYRIDYTMPNIIVECEKPIDNDRKFELESWHDDAMRKNQIKEFIDNIPEDTSKMTMVEIGSFRGVSSSVFEKYFDKVYCVDPWNIARNIVGDLGDEHFMAEIEKKFDENVEKCIKIKEMSEDAYRGFKNESIDLVYIDGNHTYDYVKCDLINWFDKVKSTGYITGHDYNLGGVKNAIQNVYNLDPSIILDDSSWIIKKSDILNNRSEPKIVKSNKNIMTNNTSSNKQFVINVIPFFDELDLLELRFEELYDTVDLFVIVEMSKTHSGKDKPLYFDLNKNRFTKYEDKIEHVIIPDNEIDKCDSWVWNRENQQRDYGLTFLKNNYKNIDDNDIIIMTDTDEIPSQDIVDKFLSLNTDIASIEMDQYMYYMNYKYLNDEHTKYINAKIFTYKYLIDHYRDVNNTYYLRYDITHHCIKSGWHFTFQGGLDNVSKKLNAYAHQELNNENVNNKEVISQFIKDGINLYRRNEKGMFKKICKDELINLNDYPNFIKRNYSYFYDNGYFLDKNKMISVVIPTCNSRLFIQCFESLLKVTDFDFEEFDFEFVIISNEVYTEVDDYLTNHDYYNTYTIKHINNLIRRGPGYSYNQGITYSSGDYIIFINDDVIFLEQDTNLWLNQLYYPFKKYDNVGLTGPVISVDEDLNRNLAESFCIMVNKKCFGDIGLLDEEFDKWGGYFNDLDLTIRLEDNKYRIIKIPVNDNCKWNDNSKLNVSSFMVYHKGATTANRSNENLNNAKNYIKNKYSPKSTESDIHVNDNGVSAVISTRNRYHTTLSSCLYSILNQTVLPNEIILYDDGDFRDLRDDPIYQNIFGICRDKGVNIKVLKGECLGQVKNHIRSLSESKYRYIWRIDDDNVCEPNVLETLKNTIINNSSVASVGGLVLHPKDEKMYRLNILANNKIDRIFFGCNLQWFKHKSKDLIEVDHLYSTFIYDREKVFKSEGYPTNLSRIGHREETIFTYNLKKAGFTNLINPSCVTWHCEIGSGGIRSKESDQYAYEDEQKFLSYLNKNNIKYKDPLFVVNHGGIGDNYAMMHVLDELIEKLSDKNFIVVSTMYPDLYKDLPNIKHYDVIHKLDLLYFLTEEQIYKLEPYTWAAENNFNGHYIDIFREMYLKGHHK